MVMGLINANPVVHERKERRTRQAPESTDETAVELIDQLEIFEHIRDIKDPEHPYSLEELNVVTEDSIEISNGLSHVRVTFTPTVEHCSMATLIGLCLRVKLMRSLPPHYKVCCGCGVHKFPSILGSHTIMKCLKGKKKKNHELTEYIIESMRFN
uniref:Uncharacterized protein n=1 Tax=Avena sativa TaxID=4498 RepID=A0ACD5T764_AVESA